MKKYFFINLFVVALMFAMTFTTDATNPKEGSKHNRGCAVDLSLYDLKTGKETDMPSPYDDFTEKAAPGYSGGTASQRRSRDLLRAAMEGGRVHGRFR